VIVTAALYPLMLAVTRQQADDGIQLGFEQDFPLEHVIGPDTCSLEARACMRPVPFLSGSLLTGTTVCKFGVPTITGQGSKHVGAYGAFALISQILRDKGVVGLYQGTFLAI
jgi:hypothetical protein